MHGVQFHPESIASEHGHVILKNFLDIAARLERRHRPPRRAGRSARSIRGLHGRRLKALIAKAATGAALTREEAEAAFDEHDVGRGDAVADRRLPDGAARARRDGRRDHRRGHGDAREDAARRSAAAGAIDVVGTGGDASGTYNISTCAAFVVAGAGVPVAKHGNRALSSRSGAADVLAALGVKHRLAARARSARCIREAGIGFMFAPAHHPAMKHVGPTRAELGTRTIFNLLGPLSQSGRRQAPDARRVLAGNGSSRSPMCSKNLGSERAWVVHGADGLDEITISGPTAVAALENGHVRTFEIAPEDVGIDRVEPRGAARRRCRPPMRRRCAACSKARRGRSATSRSSMPPRALLVAGKASDLKGGVALARQALDSGEAEASLDRLIAVSNA